MAVGPARRAAWDAYLAVTHGLLPALDSDPVDTRAVVAELTGLAARIRLWASGWGPHGAVLTAAVDSALRLRRDGRHDELVTLLRAIAGRLFRLSNGQAHPRNADR